MQQVMGLNLQSGMAETNFALQQALVNPIMQGAQQGLGTFSSVLAIGSSMDSLGMLGGGGGG